MTRAVWTAYAIMQAPRQRRAGFRSPAAVERAQRRRVHSAVAHAYQHVPYYRETIDRLGLSPADFATAGDLARLPLIERAQLQRDPEYFVSRARPIERYIKLATDGSTGAPVTVYHDPFALFKGAAYSQRADAIVSTLARKPFRLRRVFIGSPMGTVARTNRALRSRSLLPPRVLYSDLELSMLDRPARNAERITRFRADLLRCYGSYLEALFVELHRSGAAFRAPKVAVYTADGVSERIRRMITEEFGVSVLGEYGAGEAHHIAVECEEHTGLHVNCDLYPIRIVDSDGRELPDGRSGEVVVSNLVNRATVLLNYRLGDVAAKLPVRCPCGRSLPLLSLPEGRTDDWVESPSGELVHAQAVRSLVLADDQVLAFQIAQLSRAHFTVAAIIRPGAEQDRLREGIQRRFAEWFGESAIIEVSFVDSLARTSGGKVRTVISRRVRVDPAVPHAEARVQPGTSHQRARPLAVPPTGA
jgi:phenylacetate-CoA ligase